jgi:predicted esterase
MTIRSFIYNIYRIKLLSKFSNTILFICFTFFLNISIDAKLREDLMLQNDSDFTYAISLPVNYSPEKSYLLAICLHGLGGDGISMAKPFAEYTRYMNIVLACPNGNIPDPNRNATKWGGESSIDYILNFTRLMKSKYKVHPTVLLIGFSQGGNQGLLMSMRNPSIWKYFISISGGYNDFPNRFNSNAKKIKILYISGDKGAGEVYSKKKMDEKILFLKKLRANPSRIVINGQEHNVSMAIVEKSLYWFLNKSPFYQKTYWLHKGFFHNFYRNGNKKMVEKDYRSAQTLFENSIKINPIYPPGMLNFCQSSLLSGKMNYFKNSFFSIFLLYSEDSSYKRIEVFKFLDRIPLAIGKDPDLVVNFVQFLEENLIKYENIISPVFLAEINYLISTLYKEIDESEFSLDYLIKAKYIYSQLDPKDFFYKEAEANGRLEWLNSTD